MPNPIYEPLEPGYIRLVTINKRRQDALVCTMQTFRLKRKPVYHALSYVWGDETVRKPILLNGSTFDVTINLESALLRLRGSKVFVSKVWIDAICINQSDREERGHQVQLMKTIYQQALSVLVWLGRDHEPEDERLWFRSEIWGFNKLEKGTRLSTSLAFGLLAVFEPYLIFFKSEDRKDKRSWASLARLLNRSYWDRLWIIQEIQVASAAFILCGEGTVTWNSFQEVMTAILSQSGVLQRFGVDLRILPLMGADRISNVALSGVDFGNILTVLRRTRRAKCKDPRDRLYGILGIVQDNLDITLDYRKPVETVYTEWAVNRIRRTQSLDILSACADSSSGGLPSWVPDLRREWGGDRALFCRTHGLSESMQNSKFHIFRSSSAIINASLQLSVLGSKVTKIMAISEVGDPTKGLTDPTKLKDALLGIIQAWERMCLTAGVMSNPDPIIGYTEFIGNTFSGALFRGYTNWSNENNPAALWARFSIWRSNYPVPAHYHSSHPEFSDREKFLEGFERILFTMIHDCQMFVTSDKEVGMVAGDCHVQVGDEVFALASGPTLYILRQQDRRGGIPVTHRLMGPCYVSRYSGTIFDDQDYILIE